MFSDRLIPINLSAFSVPQPSVGRSRTVVFATFILFLVATPCRSQDLTGFERIFIPFAQADLSGVGGSQFRVVGASIPREPYSYWPHCEPFSSAATIGRVEIDRGTRMPSICPGGAMGRILHVDKGTADAVSFGFVIQSRAAESNSDIYHVSVPVVREREFKRNRFHVVVPFGEGRVTLRVYELSGQANPAVRVSLRASIVGWGGVPGGGTLPLASREATDRSYPSFGEMPLNLDCLLTTPRTCQEWVAGVEIEPLVEGDYWAVISRTHNTT